MKMKSFYDRKTFTLYLETPEFLAPRVRARRKTIHNVSTDEVEILGNELFVDIWDQGWKEWGTLVVATGTEITEEAEVALALDQMLRLLEVQE